MDMRAYPGTQGRYGDWALLSGSSYAPNIYNCTTRTGTCTSLTIGAAMYGNPPVGSGVCTSGYSTTQVCRQVVTDEDLSTYVAYEGGSLLVNNVAQIMPPRPAAITRASATRAAPSIRGSAAAPGTSVPWAPSPPYPVAPPPTPS
jgi:hypothetical protein